MEYICISKEKIKNITEFLIDKQIIFHPHISPNGCPDFSNYLGRNYILILDRNLLTKLLELVRKGTLNDNYLLKVISSLMFWANLNGFTITSGLALNEYANFKQSDVDASRENNIFKKIFKQYPTKLWLSLATGEINTIPKVKLNKTKDYMFNIESDHYLMHYAEMLHIMYLYFEEKLSMKKKMLNFISWNKENLLYCCYTLVYISLLFSKKIKQYKSSKLNNFDKILKICQNQAWDLTYLSFWSTLYWNEEKGNTTYLFSTMDKDLKKIFKNAHDIDRNIFIKCFGDYNGNIIQQELDDIVKNRNKPEINKDILENLIKLEKQKLKKKIKSK